MRHCLLYIGLKTYCVKDMQVYVFTIIHHHDVVLSSINFLYNIVLEGCEGVAVSTAIYIDAPYGTRPSCGSGTNWPGMAR